MACRVMTNMTIMISQQDEPINGAHVWTLARAKAKFSEVVDRAQAEGPQTVTRNGRPVVVIVSVQEWERKTKRTGNLAEFFANSPLRESGLEIERGGDRLRPIDV